MTLKSNGYHSGGLKMLNYRYVETANENSAPGGEGWEYWGDRITPDEHVAVWRRDADVYGETEAEQ